MVDSMESSRFSLKKPGTLQVLGVTFQDLEPLILCFTACRLLAIRPCLGQEKSRPPKMPQKRTRTRAGHRNPRAES